MSPRQARHLQDVPRFVAHETARHRLYPRTVRVPEYDARVSYRASRTTCVAEEEDAIFRTECFAWLKVGGQRVGAIEFTEYDPNGCGGNDDFMWIMDAEDAREAHLANVLSSAWADIVMDVTHAGAILYMQSAWLAPEFARIGIVAAAINAIAEADAGHSILLMQPFALGGRLAGERSRLHLQRTLGMQRLPGKYWPDGWLWRPNPRCARLIAEPSSAVVLPFSKRADSAECNGAADI